MMLHSAHSSSSAPTVQLMLHGAGGAVAEELPLHQRPLFVLAHVLFLLLHLFHFARLLHDWAFPPACS